MDCYRISSVVRMEYKFSITKLDVRPLIVSSRTSCKGLTRANKSKTVQLMIVYRLAPAQMNLLFNVESRVVLF